jgi:hypothetical protein
MLASQHKIWQSPKMESADIRLQSSVGRWLLKLTEVRGWNEYKRQISIRTFWHDDVIPGEFPPLGDFILPEDLNREHAIVVSYYALLSTIRSLRDCEYYFRRYPFSDLSVSKYDHLRYICEMYFGRFYEFKSRAKQCFNAVKALGIPNTPANPGLFIKHFDKEFNTELRERNKVHHHDRFEDIAIDNLFITSLLAQGSKPENGLNRRNSAFYRKLSNEWANRAVQRSKKLDEYLNVIAELLLASCPFLAEPTSDQAEGNSDFTQ